MGEMLRLVPRDNGRRASRLRARRTATSASSPAPETPSEVVAVVQAVLRLRATRRRLALEANQYALLVERAQQQAMLLQVVAREIVAISVPRVKSVTTA
jgi:hypothetical protein